jgi:hypothetical protein
MDRIIDPGKRGVIIESINKKSNIMGYVAKRKLICQNGEKRRKRGPVMAEQHPFKWRHFQAEIILLCVRWYLRYALSYRDLEEMMRERGLQIDHSTIYRWVQCYAPELEKRCRSHLKVTNDSWRVDETYVKVKGVWMGCVAKKRGKVLWASSSLLCSV